MDSRQTDGFFYGLFMDVQVLRQAGTKPSNFRIALTHAELERLYCAPGLEAYCPEAVVAHTSEGEAIPALCYNLVQMT